MSNQLFSKKRRTLLKAGTGALFMPLVIPQTAYATSKQYGIRGQQAPELEIKQWIDTNGKDRSPFKLSDHKGKYIFMEFWQSWCPGCHSHGFPSLKKISDAFKDNEHFISIAIQTTFEGFSTNTADKMLEIQKKYKLEVAMGHDAGKEGQHPKTMVDYRSGGTPWAVLISPQGKVIYNDFSINPELTIEFLKRKIAKLT